MTALWPLALLYLGFFLVTLVARKFEPSVAKAVLQVDDVGVSRQLPNGTKESVRWDELREVEILTTDEGPWCEDFFYLLIGPEGRGCCVPQVESIYSGLEERLSRLPGYDHETALVACGSTDWARFTCWQKPENQ